MMQIARPRGSFYKQSSKKLTIYSVQHAGSAHYSAECILRLNTGRSGTARQITVGTPQQFAKSSKSKNTMSSERASNFGIRKLSHPSLHHFQSPLQPENATGLTAYPLQVSNFTLLALPRSKATCPAVVCFEKPDAGSALLLGASAFIANPMLGAASPGPNVVRSVRMHFEHRNVYVQCVLLT
jgi:hypothetical protein